MNKKLYTHSLAAMLVEMFEDVLIASNIRVPSPDDDDREPDDKGLYGQTYYDLLDSVESELLEIIQQAKAGAEVIPDVFGPETDDEEVTQHGTETC